MSVLEAAVVAVQTAVDVAALVSPPGFREAMAGTSIAISYFRGNKIDAVAAGENGVLLAFELVQMISPAGRLAKIACMGIRLTYLGFGAYRMYQGYQEGSWSKMALGAMSVLLSFRRACFVAGTQVVVGVNADGSYITKAIEDIREGDYVLSRDANDPDGALVMSRVTGTYERQVDRLQVVSIKDDATGNIETLQTTAEHPFYVDGLGWTPAGELLAGQRVENPDGGFSVVVGNSCAVHTDRVSVYNFTVDGTHSYFVEDGEGAQTAVWVHNTYVAGQHHYTPVALGNRIPYGDKSLSLFGKIKHSRIQDALNIFLKNKTKTVNGKVVDMFARKGNKGSVVRANFMVQERLSAMEEFYKLHEGGRYYPSYRMELNVLNKMGGLIK